MPKLLAEDKVNAGRQTEVDLAKVLAIVAMVFVHVFEGSFTLEDVGTTVPYWLILIIEFAGGPLAAPVFMTAMGVGMAYAKRQEGRDFATRGVPLIRQGYRLNFWRAGLLYLVVFTLTGSSLWLETIVQSMLVLDILQFAGLAFLLFGLLRHMGAKAWHIVAVALVMQFVAMLVPRVAADSMLGAGIVGAFFYQNEFTTFPLFSWFMYPAAGYFFGTCLLRVADKKRFYLRILVVSALFFAVFTGVLLALGLDVTELFMSYDYYAQGLIHILWILPICALVYGLFYFVSLGVKGKIKRVVEFIGSKVNDIYIIQWILVAWLCTILTEFMHMNTLSALALACFITVVSVALAYVKARLTAPKMKRSKTE